MPGPGLKPCDSADVPVGDFQWKRFIMVYPMFDWIFCVDFIDLMDFIDFIDLMDLLMDFYQ